MDQSEFPHFLDPPGAKRAKPSPLDDLVSAAHRYRKSAEFEELLKFAVGFRRYSPYNAMLMHVQRPGARFVATPAHWKSRYQHVITAGACPIVILQPMGPVMFVFDVDDTEPLPGAPALPVEVTDFFTTRSGVLGKELERTRHNALRDGIVVRDGMTGSQLAGYVRVYSGEPRTLRYTYGVKKPVTTPVAKAFDLVLKAHASPETKYATLVHELAHVYCGHLGSSNENWWPRRGHCTHEQREFEAEAVSYLVCKRLGIDTPAERYIAKFIKSGEDVPNISLETVLTASSLIEQMGRSALKPRKPRR